MLAPGIRAATILVLLLEATASADCPRTALRWASSSRRLYVTGDVQCTLTDLDAIAPSDALRLVDATSKIWLLRANVHLEQGATLLLHGTPAGGDVDELRLLSNDSSTGIIYIRAQWGGLDIDGTRITSWDEAAAGPDVAPESNGRSFILVRSFLDSDGVTARVSRMDIRGSDIGYLGYQASESYGLVWKVYGTPSPDLYATVDVLGDVTDSHLHHNWFGGYTYGAYGMLWARNHIEHNEKYGLDPHDDSDFLQIIDNDVHDNGNHGIICSQRCNDLVIRGNHSYANVGHGIMIHRLVTNSLIEDNEVDGNSDTGIAIFDSSNNVIRGNHVHDNLNGIRLSVGAADNLIEDNLIERQSGYGFYFYKGSDAPTSGDGHVAGNTFQDNDVLSNDTALRGTDADDNLFVSNTFRYNDHGLTFIDSVDNVLEANSIPAGERILTRAEDGDARTVISKAPGALKVETDNAASVTFRETSSRSHMISGLPLVTRVTPEGSELVLGPSQIASARTVSVVRFYGRPSSGVLLLTPTATQAWSARAESGSITTVTYTVSGLTAGATYTVTRDGAAWKLVTASATGTITFTDPASTEAVTYSVGS